MAATKRKQEVFDLGGLRAAVNRAEVRHAAAERLKKQADELVESTRRALNLAKQRLKDAGE